MAGAINVGAALVAALAFGAWKRLNPPQVEHSTRMEGTITAGFYEQHVDDVGFITLANKHVTARELAGSRVLYDAVYTTGADHFRLVPTATKADRCILLFGDSFTFGEGVSDDETSAAQIVEKSGGRVAAKNFGIGGWGPHQFLAGIQSGRFRRAVSCTPTDALYLLIPAQLARVAGIDQWDKYGPRFRLGPDGRPVRAGNFDDSTFSWRRLIGLDAMSETGQADLAAALIIEGSRDLKQHYPGLRFQVLIWNTDNSFPRDVMKRTERGITAAGIGIHSMAEVIPQFSKVWPDYVLAPDLEWHPNARAYERIADFAIRLTR
ncbi:MAG: hypothetical protein JSR91_00480 [Proteobacteria bacterium]|nr:hypothetical protein [Pseudomonadota bacterium]